MSQVCIYQHCCSASNAARPIRNKSGNSSFFCLMAHTQTSFEFSCRVSPRGIAQGYILSRVNNRTPPARENRPNSNTHIRVSRHTLLNDKLAITSADTLQHRCDPRGQWRGSFTLPNAELKCKTCHLVTNSFISVLDRRCPAPLGGALNSCGQFAVLCVCLSLWESHGGSLWDKL